MNAPRDGEAPRLVVASANPDKAAEIVAILSACLGERVTLVPRPSDVAEVAETGASLEENARLKAVALRGATGLGAVADDSGLEVDVLDGRPGIYSARYAGPGASYGDNVAKLLVELEGHSDRRARFRTVALCALTNGLEIVAEGVCEGTIATEVRGTGGFGYDPIFLAEDAGGKSFGELSDDEKHARSARGRAFRSLGKRLEALLTSNAHLGD